MYDKVYCPACKKYCYVNLGDLNDCTVPDIDGCQCPYCGHEWIFEEVLEFEPDKIVEDSFIELGLTRLD